MFGNVMMLSSTPAAPSLDTITGAGGDMLEFAITQGTQVVNWILGNPYTLAMLGMFIGGFAVSMIARIVYAL